MTSQWTNLLGPLTEILSDSTTATPSQSSKAAARPPARRYRVKLHALTVEVSFIIACVITSYTFMAYEQGPVAAKFQHMMNNSVNPSATGPYAAPSNTSTTDSDNSDSSDHEGWQRASHSHRRDSRRGSVYHLTNRRKQWLKEFAQNEMQDPRCRADSGRPDLQLGTRVTSRLWEHRFVSMQITNWQSLQCDLTGDLVEDEQYQRVIAHFSEFTAGSALWTTHRKIGDSVVSLIVREDLKERICGINARLRERLNMPNAALVVQCTMVRRAWGRVIPNTDTNVTLTPEVEVPPVRSSQHRPPLQAQSAASPPIPGSYAACVNAAAMRVTNARRSPNNPPPTGPHPHPPNRSTKSPTSQSPAAQPKGGTGAKPSPPALQNTGTHSASSPATPSSTPASQQQTPLSSSSASGAHQPVPEWQRALSKLQTEMDSLRTKLAALSDLPRQIADFQHRQQARDEHLERRLADVQNHHQEEMKGIVGLFREEMRGMMNQVCSTFSGQVSALHGTVDSLSVQHLSSTDMNMNAIPVPFGTAHNGLAALHE
jgi:hypothetical protein